ncbi:hypothetical protein XH93_11345 [Bradyrhizobium sp. CCBAU 51753]|nr:hypothetical protein XH93_11345 [Bradyrhizobium sp. CCBAU 51753]
MKRLQGKLALAHGNGFAESPPFLNREPTFQARIVTGIAAAAALALGLLFEASHSLGIRPTRAAQIIIVLIAIFL